MISAILILSVWGISKTIQTYRAQEARTQSLRKEIQLLEETKTKTEAEKQQLKKDREQLKADYEKLKQTKAVVKTAYAKPAKLVVPSGDCLTWMKLAGITDTANAYTLIMRESGCRVNARNASSGALGIPQALPGSKMASAGADWRTNPVTQLRWMQNYCISRYGSWAGAVAHSTAKGWY